MKLTPKKIGSLLSEVAMSHADEQKEGVRFLAKLIFKSGKTSKLGSIISTFKKKYNEENNIVDVTVTAASEHSLPHLKELNGKKISLKKVVNPKVLGGIKIQTEDFLVDNTVMSRINQLRNI